MKLFIQLMLKNVNVIIYNFFSFFLVLKTFYFFKNKTKLSLSFIMSSQFITPSHAKKLANEKGNVVYGYEFDSVDHVKPASLVETLLNETFLEYITVREKNPLWDDNQCRQYLFHSNNKLADFAKTHPRFFETMTNRTSTEKELVPLFKMIEIKKREERRELTANEASQLNQQFQIEYWKTGLSEEEYNKLRDEKKPE